MVLTDEMYNKVWDRVSSELGFCPSIKPEVRPFTISVPYVVYDIRKSWQTDEDEFDALISAALTNCTLPGEKLYALDWQHSAFLYDPRKPEESKSVYVEDPQGGYWENFPDFYPDGDYCFFIDEQFCFGYLGHPWREEVWIFGQALIAQFRNIREKLNWTVKEDLG